MAKKERQDISFSLLANGLDFISSALEHLSGRAPTQRDLKYAVLHLSSGIELVLKERLRREHWSLLFADSDRVNQQAYQAGDFTSVSFRPCLDRLEGACGVEIGAKGKEVLKAIRDKRNRLEHFGIVDAVAAITSTAANALSFLLDFINRELEPEKLGEEDSRTLGAIRGKLGDFGQFVKERWRQIEKKVQGSTTAVVSCPACLQKAAVIDCGVSCLFCGFEAGEDEAADAYIREVMGEDHYTTVKDGGMWPRYDCPECEVETLVRHSAGDESQSSEYVCFSCGTAWDWGELAICDSCGQPYDHEKVDMAICRKCFEVRIAKDD